MTVARSGQLGLADAVATDRCAGSLAQALLALAPARLMIHLEGDLGAGKTSFARGLLVGLGHRGRVPSPTYTLVEPYEVAGYLVLHVDLYRLRDPSELSHIGLVEQLGEGSVALVEWPDHGGAELPAADLRLQFIMQDPGRQLAWEARTAAGSALAAAWMEQIQTRIPPHSDP